MNDWLAGVDLGGTSIKAAIADGAGNLRLTRSVPTESHRGPEDVVRRIGELVFSALRDLDKVAFVRFASVYREFQDVHDFVEELQPILDGRRRDPRP